MIVADLADHPRFVSPLVETFAREWPQWAATQDRAQLEAIFADGPQGALPLVLVAFDGDELQGTIALRPWFAETPMVETPWVRQLYVFPRHRGRGVDRRLAAALEHRARDLGFRFLHAATNRIERLLVRRGWEVLRRGSHEGAAMAFLRKEIAGVAGEGGRIASRDTPKLESDPNYPRR